MNVKPTRYHLHVLLPCTCTCLYPVSGFVRTVFVCASITSHFQDHELNLTKKIEHAVFKALLCHF